MSQNQKVTIGIPTWNRSSYVVEAIRSALAQSYQNLEIIVSDNASTDDTWEKLQQFQDNRIALLRQQSNIGGIANLNACLRHATGEFFLLLSDDDLLAHRAIEELSAPFITGEAGIPAASIGLVWCPCITIDADEKDVWVTSSGPRVESSAALMTELFNGNRGPRLASVLIRTADAISAGGYNEERHNAMCDTGNWGQIALRYDNTVCVGEALVKYRIHSGSHTSRSLCADWQRWGSDMHQDLAAVLESHGNHAGYRKLMRVKNNLLANLTVDVLMRGMGKPGWKTAMAKEFWRSRRFMLTPYVARRVLRDGWKLLRVKK